MNKTYYIIVDKNTGDLGNTTLFETDFEAEDMAARMGLSLKGLLKNKEYETKEIKLVAERK